MPSAAPMMAASDRGESITRSGPYLSNSFSVARNTPPRLPTSSPITTTRSSRAISSSRVRAIVCTMLSIVTTFPPAGAHVRASSQQLLALPRQVWRNRLQNVIEHPLDRNRSGGLGFRLGGGELGLDLLLRLDLGFLAPQRLALEEAPEPRL